MSYHFTPNMLPLVIAALIAGILAWYTWQHRQSTGVRPFSLMMLILFEWVFSYILELAATDLDSKFFWTQLKFAGVIATPVVWLLFALEYTGRKAWTTRTRIILLSILPLVSMGMILTNDFHHLFWLGKSLASEGGFLLLSTIYGPWFWVHAAYTYTLIMIGLVLVIRALLRWPAQYRGQMLWILLATLAPLIANVLTIFKIVPALLDWTPFAFIITGIGMAYALFRHRLLDIAPLARDIVIDGMKDGMIVLDANQRIVDINPAAQSIIGLSGEKQPIGKSMAEVLSRQPGLIEKYRGVDEISDEMTFGEGETQRWYDLNLTTLRDENKMVLGQLITIRDITQRKHTESLLQESEARFRQIVENASDMIYRFDGEGRLTYANPSALHTMGFENEADALGKYFLDLTTPEMRHKLKRTYLHQFMSKTPNTYNEFPGLTADGREVWFGQNVQLIFEDDQVVGFQALSRDITAIKQAYEALRIARDQALEANRAKTQLLSKVSHELRTPLGGVLGYAELLHDNTFGELNLGQKKAAHEIMESANYLTNMVNELLDEAQARTNITVLQEALFAPAILIQQSTAGTEVLAKKKGLQLNTSLDPNLPHELYGDERRLRQIIINLVGNAIKFTKEGSVNVKFLRPTHEHWAIQVMDTGVGIPREAQAYIFEPFRQVDSAITRDNRGIGLGLSITKQLVDIMGGRITLESEPGQGSAFTVLLPIKTKTGETS
ncbi:MAG: histidine kinase N-terminal 7TM domain-containing protein [Chloroflexota bacterium]